MFPKGKYNTDISSPSNRKQIGIVGERMFDEKRIHFMNTYCKETKKPFGYLLMDNKPNTPADKQVLGDIFGETYVYHFDVRSPVETKPAGKRVNSTSPVTKTKPARKRFLQAVAWRMSNR